MPLSPQAFSAPSKQMHGSNPKGDLNSIASISTSSTISIPSSEPSASKPRDSKLKREQNPRYRRHNGLIQRFRGSNHMPRHSGARPSAEGRGSKNPESRHLGRWLLDRVRLRFASAPRNDELG